MGLRWGTAVPDPAFQRTMQGEAPSGMKATFLLLFHSSTALPLAYSLALHFWD